jgi:hypothetical protein
LFSFNFFKPRKHFDLKKCARIGHFKVWFGAKAANIGNFGHLNFTELAEGQAAGQADGQT